MKRNILAVALLGLALTGASAQEENLIYHHPLGNTEVVLLSDAQNENAPDPLIGASEEILKTFVPTGKAKGAMNVFLLKLGGKKILVDTAMGIRLIDNLKKEGIAPEEIDIILITHMHGDHIGGLTKEGKACFPKAQVYISKKEYEYWTNKEYIASLPEAQRRSFNNVETALKPYEGRITLFEPNDIEHMTELIPNVKSIATYGHTPGHTSYLVEQGGDQLFIWGDLVNITAVQVPHPELATRYDVDPKQAAETRAHVLDYLAKQGMSVAGMHVGFPAMGKLVPTDKGLVLSFFE